MEEEGKGEGETLFAEQVREYMRGEDERFDEACRRVYARFVDMGREADVPDVIRKELGSNRTPQLNVSQSSFRSAFLPRMMPSS